MGRDGAPNQATSPELNVEQHEEVSTHVQYSELVERLTDVPPGSVRTHEHNRYDDESAPGPLLSEPA